MTTITKQAAIDVVRAALVAHEWPPQDGDRQIDDAIAALNALPAVDEWREISDSQLAAIRAKVIEECADIADKAYGGIIEGYEIGDAIRAQAVPQ